MSDAVVVHDRHNVMVKSITVAEDSFENFCSSAAALRWDLKRISMPLHRRFGIYFQFEIKTTSD